MRDYVQGYQLIAIDEAQQIPSIGMGLKIIVDQNPKIRVIATGSSSFDLAHQIGEPLTGRKRTITLFPVAQHELMLWMTRYELKEKLEEFLIYGNYPQVLTAKSLKEKKLVLLEIAESYLLKDILALDRMRASRILMDLLKLLAFQLGSEVSLNELAGQLKVDVKTVGRYLDLLEKTFVIVSLSGFGRNLRKEITSKKKYYFLDNGIRNAVIMQFNSLSTRNDVGALWENFIVTERIKKKSYEGRLIPGYFWRTYDQQEIDLIEEDGGRLHAYECKYSMTKKTPKPPVGWLGAYPEAKFTVIHAQNYLDFIG